MKLIKVIRRLFHRHEWEGTRYNAYYIPVEEFCRSCGEYRHHLLADSFGEEITFRKGKHPNRDTKPKALNQ